MHDSGHKIEFIGKFGYMLPQSLIDVVHCCSPQLLYDTMNPLCDKMIECLCCSYCIERWNRKHLGLLIHNA